MICPKITRVSKIIEYDVERKYPGSCKAATQVGDEVNPESVIAHCEVSAGQRLIKIAHSLGASSKDVQKYLLRKIGDRIYRGEIIARRRRFLGLAKKEIKSPADGVITEINANGDLIVKFLPTPVRLVAGAKGEVTKIGQDSIFVKSKGIQIKGYAGDGRMREGLIKIIAAPNEFVIPQKITAESAGKILVGGSLLERATIEKAVTIGVHGLVVGGINHRDFLSLGVGTDIGTSVLITEGFGTFSMGKDIYNSLKERENQFGFISGEGKDLFVPDSKAVSVVDSTDTLWKEVQVGDTVRVARQHSEDVIGRVESLSQKEEVLNSGVSAEVAKVKFLSGKTITVASANIDIVET